MSLTENLRVEPVQARAKARVESILTAARIHYGEVGRDSFDLDVVAAQAGCSVATVYRYFEDQVALLNMVAPDRDRAEIKLSAIKSIQTMGGSDAEKWLAVVHILNQP